MTSEFENPLDGLLSKELVARIWNDVRLSDAVKIETIMKMIDRVYKGYSLVLHPDTFSGDGSYMRALEAAKSMIDLDSLPSLIEWLLGENAQAAAYARHVTETRRQLRESRIIALGNMLSAINPRTLVGPQRHELIVRIGANGYIQRGDGTFIVLRERSDDQGLFDTSLLEPKQPSRSDTIILTEGNPFFRKGKWHINAVAMDGTENPDELLEASSKVEPPLIEAKNWGVVRLVGGIDREDHAALIEKVSDDRTASDLTQIAQHEDASIHKVQKDFSWSDPKDAWWLPSIQPGGMTPGNYLVVATPNVGGKISFAGEVIAMRALD